MTSTPQRQHELKTDPEVFDVVAAGTKTHELRLNDRDYQVGDHLLLRRTKHTGAEMQAGAPLVFTGESCERTVSHVLSGYGLQEGWVVLSLAGADGDMMSREQYRRMFGAACEALGSINDALGLEPHEDGAEPILHAIGQWKQALKFYADQGHFHMHRPEAWDTVSGEPPNFWEDEEASATVEDGTIASLVLAGKDLDWDEDDVTADALADLAAEQPDSVQQLMEQAQVYASAWALVGSMFDQENNCLQDAEAEKAKLRKMVAAAVQPDAAPAMVPAGYLMHWPKPGGGRSVLWSEDGLAGKAIGCPVEQVFKSATPTTSIASDEGGAA